MRVMLRWKVCEYILDEKVESDEVDGGNEEWDEVFRFIVFFVVVYFFFCF